MAVEKILLEFDADIKALRSDMNQVKSQLSDVEKQGNKTTSQLSSGFKRVGAAIGAAFSVQLLIQFTKRAVELYDIQAKAEASLLQALKGREDVQRRLMGQASELQKITLFGDEETIKAQAMLAKFGMTETQIRRLIPLIQDYAAAQGQDLVSAADMVARSVGSSTNALSRYGIEINGAVGSNERLESAVESLSEMFGGQAVAAAEAGAGAVQQFQNAWGDFAESVGDWIMPALTKVVKGLDNIISAFAVAGKSAAEMRIAVREAFDDKQYTMEQDLFIEYLKEDKDRFNDLEGAAESYLSVVNDIIADYNEQISSGVQLTKVQQDTYKSYVIQTEAVRDYVNANKDARITIDDLNKSNEKLGKGFKVNKDELASFISELRNLNSVVVESIALNGLNVESLAKVFLNYEKNLQGIKNTTAEYVDTTISAADKALEKQREIAAFYDIAGSSIDFFSTLSSRAADQYIADLQRQLDAGKITQEQFDRERKKALREQAKDTRALAVFDIVLNTARAVMSFLAQTPPNVPGSIAAGVAGALQLSTAITQPLPAFATGTVDLKGEGTETSDSIIARLSKGESVITAKGTRQDKALFEAANKLQLEDYINKNYVLPALVKVQKDKADMFDDYRLYMSLQNMKKSDKENTDKIVRAIKTEYTNNRRYWA